MENSTLHQESPRALFHASLNMCPLDFTVGKMARLMYFL